MAQQNADVSGEASIVSRIWARDVSLWSDDKSVQQSIRNRLGWLDSITWVSSRVEELTAWSQEIRDAGFERVIVLGMGGSSLAPEVFASVYGNQNHAPALWILDDTSPNAIEAIINQDLGNTLFIVASKSGGTVETSCFCEFFFAHVKANYPARPAGTHFVAITDSGSRLEQLADERNFNKCFVNPSDIGGRFSVFSYFGMVPAALIRLPLKEFLSSAQAAVEVCKLEDPEKNQGLRLGRFIAQQALAGKDKMVLHSSKGLQSLGVWIEQLIAESTGKLGVGIVPVLQDDGVGMDRCIVTNTKSVLDENTPHLQIDVVEPHPLAREFFYWEFATAVAGHLLKINPFDEPNVSESKGNTNHILVSGYTDVRAADYEVNFTTDVQELKHKLQSFAADAPDTHYLALLIYAAQDTATQAAVGSFVKSVLGGMANVCTTGFGPRYLHSTGQLHKGGKNNGAFILFTFENDKDFDVPGTPYTFGKLNNAQSAGDSMSLRQHERCLLHVHSRLPPQVLFETMAVS